MTYNTYNIEKSGFHRGEYVGYGGGDVYRIQRVKDYWLATPRHDKRKCALTGGTLKELSSKLSKLAWVPTESGN